MLKAVGVGAYLLGLAEVAHLLRGPRPVSPLAVPLAFAVLALQAWLFSGIGRRWA